MQNINQYRKKAGLIIILYLLYFALCIKGDIGYAKIVNVTGKALYSVDSKWKPIEPNKIIYEGTTIKTGDKSNIDIYIKQGRTYIRMMTNTTIVLEKMHFKYNASREIEADTTLKIDNGSIKVMVDSTAFSHSELNVKAPFGQSKATKSEYDINAKGVVCVNSGEIQIKDTNNVSVSEAYIITKGKTIIFPLNNDNNKIPIIKETADDTNNINEAVYKGIREMYNKIDPISFDD